MNEEITVKEYTEAHIKDVEAKIGKLNFELDQLKFLHEQLNISLKAIETKVDDIAEGELVEEVV